MNNYDARHIRNIAILGHQSSGKTTLVESLAFCSGLISKKGEVEKKNTISDYNLDEVITFFFMWSLMNKKNKVL